MKSLIFALLALNLFSCSTDEASTLQNDEAKNFGQLYPRNLVSGINEVSGDSDITVEDAYQHSLGDWTQMAAYVLEFRGPDAGMPRVIKVEVDGQSMEASLRGITPNNYRGAYVRLMDSRNATEVYSLVFYAKKEWGNKDVKLHVIQGQKTMSKFIRIGAPLKPTQSSDYTVSVTSDSPMISASAYVSVTGGEEVLVIDASVQSLSHDKLFVFRDRDVVQRTMQPVWSRETILEFATGKFNGWKSDTVRYLGRSNGREAFRLYVSKFNHRHGPIAQREAYQLDYVVDPKIEIDGRMNTRKILGDTGSIKILVSK